MKPYVQVEEVVISEPYVQVEEVVVSVQVEEAVFIINY